MASTKVPRGPGLVPDPERFRRAVREFLEALGPFADDPPLLEASTERIAQAWSGDLLSGYAVDAGSILEPMPAQGESGMVLAQDVEFTSFCVHHLLPFSGVVHLAYLPAGSITGLSKLARLVDALARRLQMQEKLTGELVSILDASLRPHGAAAVVEAEHLCMTARGIRSRGSRVVTTAWSGRFASNLDEQRALLALLGNRPG